MRFLATREMRRVLSVTMVVSFIFLAAAGKSESNEANVIGLQVCGARSLGQGNDVLMMHILLKQENFLCQ